MKTPIKPRPVAEVLAELQAKHPELAQCAEVDRDWVWLAVDLRGDDNKAVRESIGRRGMGFIYAPGGHPLPSGRIGTWAHHTNHPIRFKRRGKSTTTTPETQQPSASEVSDAELLAVL